jgi:hypothetical protein
VSVDSAFCPLKKAISVERMMRLVPPLAARSSAKRILVTLVSRADSARIPNASILIRKPVALLFEQH